MKISEIKKFLDDIKFKNMGDGVMVFNERFGRHHYKNKKRIQIIIYIIIDVFSGRKSKKKKIVLRFSLVLAIKAAKCVFYIY